MKDILLRFMEKAGKIAKKHQSSFDDRNNYLKENDARSIVTEVDLKISSLFKTFLQKNMIDEDYALIDEESVSSLGSDKFKTAAAKTYQFIIDPIDGTLSYSLGTPLYGIVVGIFKNMKPYMGCLYCPGLNELVIYDGNDIENIKNPFTKSAKSHFLKEIKQKPVLVFPKPNTTKINVHILDKKKEVVVDFYSAAVHCLYLILGKAKAYHYSNIYLWDIAGAWPILNKLGLGLYNLKTGKELKKVSNADFSENFKIKESHIVCKKKDFARMQEIIVPR